VLDEPTNDLDLPTLSVLENFLIDFPGCVLIISHDRYFMDRLVNHLFVFEGDGEIRDYPGNYSQYREWQKVQESAPAQPAKPQVANTPVVPSAPAEPDVAKIKRKLSFKEQYEFNSLESEVAKLEAERKQATEKLAQPNLPYNELQSLTERIGMLNAAIEEKEMRWLELSE
jgi:ATP-binding cassette subfamily F protein uup